MGAIAGCDRDMPRLIQKPAAAGFANQPGAFRLISTAPCEHRGIDDKRNKKPDSCRSVVFGWNQRRQRNGGKQRREEASEVCAIKHAVALQELVSRSQELSFGHGDTSNEA